MMDKNAKQILIVDDQDNWRKALEKLLGQEGYIVETVASFKEAKDRILQAVFDLLVLDVRLTDADVFNVQGLELLRLAKSQERVPAVIILTGYPESIRKGVLKRYNADALMLKVPPGARFDPQAFKNKVRELLS